MILTWPRRTLATHFMWTTTLVQVSNTLHTWPSNTLAACYTFDLLALYQHVTHLSLQHASHTRVIQTVDHSACVSISGFLCLNWRVLFSYWRFQQYNSFESRSIQLLAHWQLFGAANLHSWPLSSSQIHVNTLNRTYSLTTWSQACGYSYVRKRYFKQVLNYLTLDSTSWLCVLA